MDKENIKVLHITPHLGGGVGTVLLNWLTFDKVYSHSVITLDFANDHAKHVCDEKNIALYSQVKTEKVFDLINNSDIVVIHFWNHPLLYDFIIKNQLPPCRLIMWAHVSGLVVPYVITDKILNYPDKFIYTTPISNEIKENTVILSTGGIDRFKDVELIPHEGFNVGYIGTVDYAKMHPKYVETLSKTNADRIIVLGGNQEKEISKNADERFEFMGKVSNIIPYLQQMDVFGYLLNPKHFGTAEQVIQEAMSVGIVPVVLNNKCEQSLIVHNENGLIANNLDEYVEYINILKSDKDLYNKLSKNAKDFANANYSLGKLFEQWEKEFNEILNVEKTSKKWEAIDDLTSFKIFLESLGKDSTLFLNKTKNEIKEMLKDSNWQSNSKGTPKQYLEFLGGEELESICELYE